MNSSANMRIARTKRVRESEAGARPPLVVGGLFAGIGGIERGLHLAGHDTVLLCEIDPAACAVLEERFPDVKLHGDIRTPFTLNREIDLLTAGFPCQDFSQAGQTKGLGGERSSLVSHVFDLLRRRPVPWVLLENVPFMLHLARGHAMEYLVSEFEALGYKWAYRVIDTRAFGLPQRRERVYFVASKDDDPRRVLFKGNVDTLSGFRLNGKTSYGFYWTEGARGLGWAVDAVPTLKGGSTIGIPSSPAIVLPDGNVVTPDIRDAERLQGFPADWTTPAESVTKKSVRWKLVGNAVTVDAAKWIGERLRKLDGSTTVAGKVLPPGSPWPHAAWNVGEGRFSAALSTWPLATEGPHLVDFLKYEPSPLSQRATAGFLSRFKASRLQKPPGFVEALERHLSKMSEIDSQPRGSRRKSRA